MNWIKKYNVLIGHQFSPGSSFLFSFLFIHKFNQNLAETIQLSYFLTQKML